MTLSKRFLQSLALIPLVAGTTALAASTQYTTATASVSNLRIELVDLDPNDGITPYLTYRENEYPMYGGSGTLIDHEARDLPPHEMRHHSADPFGARSLSMVLNSPADLPAGNAAGHAVFSGTSLDTLHLSASASFDSTYGQRRNVWAYSMFHPTDYYLSPNTALSITVDLSVESVMEGGSSGDDGSIHDWSNSYAAFVLGNQWRNHVFELSHSVYGNNHTPPRGTAGTRTFTAQISSGAIESMVSMGASASVTSYFNAGPAPVPEAQGWAMMLGGLGLIGAMARRRRHASRTA